MDQFIVSIESPGMPGYAHQTTIATEAQVEDLKIAAEHYGLKAVVYRPAAVGTVLVWMASRHKPQADTEPGISPDLMPPDLARVLRDPSIVVEQDQAVWELLASWRNAPSSTASAD